MKLIAVIENISDEYGGPANSLPSLIEFLKKEKINSEIVSVTSSVDEFNTLIEKFSLTWHKCPRVGFGKLQYSKQLRLTLNDIVDDGSSGILFSNNLWNYPALLSYQISKKHDVPHIISVRGSLYPWSLEQNKMLKKIAWKLFQKKALQKAALIHVTCKEELEAIRDLGVKTPVALCPHGIDYSSYQCLPNRLDSLNQLGLDVQKKYILFMSRLHKKKGLDHLLNVWPDLSNRYPDWCLLVVGPDYGGYNTKIDELRHSYNLHTSLIRLGMVKGKAKKHVLASSSFFVLPSYSENFGVVIGEALASGLPVVTTNCVPWGEVESHSCGKYIELSEENLSLSIQEMIQAGDDELEAMGQRGKKLILENYSWEAQASKFANALNFIKTGKLVPGVIFE